MMKVGVFTFPNSRSYGAALQMFALYQTCRDMGYDAEVINYYNLWMKQEKHMHIGQGTNAAILWGKRKVYDLLHLRMKARFARFEGMMRKYPPKSFSCKAQLVPLAKRYGAVICGSDQVWNPDITDHDLSYFLDFCGKETSRISYAPSFGVESISGEFAQAAAEELKAFDHLSVREGEGQNLIRKLTGMEAKLVLDPTFLLDAGKWEKYEKICPQAKGEYILYYTVHNSRVLWQKCLELAQKTNMKILRIGANMISKYLKKEDRVEYVTDVGPDQWLYLLHHASYIMTNSFHGTAFSINYRKNFYVEFSSATNSRLTNIVGLLGLEDRVLHQNLDIVPSAADYSGVETVLSRLIEDSHGFLENALGCAAIKQGE